jgi:hypothetical protein
MTDIAMAGTFRLADVFGKAFTIYGRRFLPFIALTVIASIPSYIALFVFPSRQPGVGMVGVILVQFVTRSLASGAVIYGVVQDLRGRTFSVADSILIAVGRLLPMLGAAICAALAIVFGCILLIVPGIMWACMFYVAIPACVAERAGVFESLSRSRFLTKGYRWQVFGTFLLVAAAGLVVGPIVGIGLAFTGLIGTLIGIQVLQAIISAFNGVLIGVFYYELRVAREGIDIDKIASVFD